MLKSVCGKKRKTKFNINIIKYTTAI